MVRVRYKNIPGQISLFDFWPWNKMKKYLMLALM